MNNNKDLIVYKENFITKTINFLKKLFKIRKQEPKNISEEETKESLKTEKEFKDSILIKQDEEETKLLKLQKSYKNKEIIEEDIPEDYKEKLLQLYKKQNETMRNKVEQEKKEIKKLLDSLKAS